MTLPSLKIPLEEPLVYHGVKIKDRNPDLRAAGIRAPRSYERAKDCLICPEKEISPEVLKKFHGFFMPEPGVQRVFYGQVFDHERKLAKTMGHGLRIENRDSCGRIIHPPLKTNFQKKLADMKENIYASRNLAPLGRNCLRPLYVPKNVKSMVDTFGKPLDKSDSLYTVVNPPLSYPEVMDEVHKYHKLYVKTHRDFYPGEQLKRCYPSPPFHPCQRFGDVMPHWNEGKAMKDTLNWTTLTEEKNTARIVPKLQDDFRERSQPQLELPFDPIKDSFHVPADYCFGYAPPCEGLGVRDTMHFGCPLQDIKNPFQMRGLLMSTRRFLRERLYQNFDDLLSNLSQIDKEGTDRLPVSTVMDFCLEYKLPVDFCILGAILQNCNPGDGKLFYANFVDFINWKKPLPNFDEFPINPASLMNEVNCPERIKTEKCIHTENPTAINPDSFKTTNSEINAFVGKVSTEDWKKSGVPTIRCDLIPPRLKTVANRINYGDEGTSHDFLNPTIFSVNGISTEDMKAPRSFKEIFEIFTLVGFNVDRETLEKFYEDLAKEDPKGKVSVESYWNFLNTLPPLNLECSC